VQISPTNTLHIVDDTDSFRTALRNAWERSWDQSGRSSSERPTFREWDFIWDLTKWLEAGTVEPQRGDIVVTDLYPSGFWARVKHLAEPPTQKQIKTLPGDPTNMYRAALDIRKRFLPVLTEHKLQVVILTFLPRFIEGIKPAETPLSHEQLVDIANKVRAAIKVEDWVVIEKYNREVRDPRNVEEAVTTVNDLLKGETPEPHGP
jgi:hypothetical protein